MKNNMINVFMGLKMTAQLDGVEINLQESDGPRLGNGSETIEEILAREAYIILRDRESQAVIDEAKKQLIAEGWVKA